MNDPRVALHIELTAIEGVGQQAKMVHGHGVRDLSLGTRHVARPDDGPRQVEHDRDDRDTVAGGDAADRPTGRGGDVRRIDDGQPAGRQAAVQRSMESSKGGSGRRLVGRVARDLRAQRVRGQDGLRREVPGGERRLAGAGRPDEQHDGGIGNPELGHPGDDPTARRIG